MLNDLLPQRSKNFIAFALFFSVNGVAMTPIFGTEVVLFSPMQGKLTYKGKPASNAKIVRHIIWKDEIGEKETFYSNENGEFNLPVKREKVKIPRLGEFVISQEIVVFYEGQQFEIWGISKHNTEEYGERKS